ncbi:hypothetical protein ACDX78_01770 [Virgibacillus oceani]
MSDKKQVIHVKDLVIKADNVVLDTPERRRPPRHLLFGFPGERRDEESESSSSSFDLESSDEKGKDEDDKRPFSWI